jgi:RNA polymerase sigma factor (sigma-70 family)
MTQIEFSSKLISMHDNLSYFANILTRDHEEAKDLIQETYLKALTNREKFADDTNLKAWTYTIMKNTFINNYRRSLRVKTIADHTGEQFLLNLPRKSEIVSPESHLSLQEIRMGISHLDPDQRMPFEMHTQGYKYKEIAEHLKLSIGTVKSRIFIIRNKLMEMLKDFRD